MGVEFLLGRQDHKLVADWIATRPTGVSGIVLDSRSLARQALAIEAAKGAGIAVRIETLTERYPHDGLDRDATPYGRLLADFNPNSPADLDELVESVVEHQVEAATIITPPHFFATDADGVARNLSLQRIAFHRYGNAYLIRPVLALSRAYVAKPGVAGDLGRSLAAIGVRELELRLSPLGGANESLQKILSALNALRELRHAGLQLWLGFQGPIARAAFALGLIEGFSSGITVHESYDYAATIQQQKARSKLKQAGKSGGAGFRVLLPYADVLLPLQVAREVYRDPGIRARVPCDKENCADSIVGPTVDPRRHFLHRRAADFAEVASQPLQWRAKLEEDRLTQAIALQRRLNQHHLHKYQVNDRVARIQTGTFESLRDLLRGGYATAAAV
jgi:hypothetical protein